MTAMLRCSASWFQCLVLCYPVSRNSISVGTLLALGSRLSVPSVGMTGSSWTLGRRLIRRVWPDVASVSQLIMAMRGRCWGVKVCPRPSVACKERRANAATSCAPRYARPISALFLYSATDVEHTPASGVSSSRVGAMVSQDRVVGALSSEFAKVCILITGLRRLLLRGLAPHAVPRPGMCCCLRHRLASPPRLRACA